MLFPAWLLLFWRDVRDDAPLTWHKVNVFERYAYAGTTAALLGISAFWFTKITDGLLSAISGSKGPKRGSKAA